MNPSRALLGLALLLTLSCSRGSDEGDLRTVTTGPDGTVTVHWRSLPGYAPALDTLAVWDLWSEHAGFLFTGVADAAGTGEVFWLLDASRDRLVRVAPDGRVLSVVGRPGAGPGELRTVTRLFSDSGRLWAADLSNSRFSVFAPDGTHLDDVPWRSSLRLVNRFAVLPDTQVLHAGMWPLTVAELASQAPTYYLARYAAEHAAAPLDTLARVRAGAYHAVPLTAEDGGQRTYFGAPVWDADLRWTLVGSDRVVTATGTGFRLEVRDVTGAVLGTIEVDAPPIPAGRAWRDWFFEYGVEAALNIREEFELDAASRERFPFAPVVPRIEALTADHQGRLWLLVRTRVAGRSRTEVFTPEGDYLGGFEDLPLPVAFTASGAALLRLPGPEGTERFVVVRVRFGQGGP